MNTATITVLPPPPAPAAGSAARTRAAEAWDEICAGLGIATLSAEEAANLPPWTEAEAAAFERTIEEAFEGVEPAAAA